MIRLGPVVGVAVAALGLAAASSAGAARCCFLVDARVSGRLSVTAGADLEAPGASAYRARWRWSVRHVARYVEHGRIFNALTQTGRARQRGLSIRFSEERTGLRGAACRRAVSRELVGRNADAYVSLEDTTEGKIALVVRAEHATLRPRCSPKLALPAAHARPAPAGVVLRQARALSLAWRDPIRVEGGRVVGSVEVRVRLRAAPPRRAAAASRGGRPAALSPRPSGARLSHA